MLETFCTILSTVFGLPLVLSYLSYRARKSTEPSAYVEKLWLYPVKSCGGMQVEELICQPHGLEYKGLIDRSFCLFEETDQIPCILTLKLNHRMSLIIPRWEHGRMVLSAPGVEDLTMEYDEKFFTGKPSITVRKNRDTQTLVDCGSAASDWASRVMGRPVRVGYSGFFYKRRMERIYCQQDLYGAQYLSKGRTVVHIVSRASLKDLVDRVETDLPDDQFRQPVLVDGCMPYAEDGWRDIAIGESCMYQLMPAIRCGVINNNPRTGEPHPNGEPLSTLNRYRRTKNGPPFGIRVGIQLVGKRIRIGDPVYTTDIII